MRNHLAQSYMAKIGASTLYQKFATEVISGLSSVMPANAGIQVGTGYFFDFQKVACPLSGIWIPGRVTPDCDPGLPGMTIELYDELLRHHTRLSNQSAIRIGLRSAQA